MAQKDKRTKIWPDLIKKWSIRLILGFFVISLSWVIILKFVNPPYTILMFQRGIEQKRNGLDWSVRQQWVSYENLSDNLKRAAIAGEDAHFMTHSGFDTQAIKNAIQRNKSGESLRGGSTISQQTAKNIFLWPNRSWIRKGFEAYFTVLIELIWGKKRILEVYLNMIEMGEGIFGAEVATQQFYKKSASNLSKREAALIIAVLPNPRRWSPTKPTNFIERKTNTIIRYMGHYQIP